MRDDEHATYMRSKSADLSTHLPGGVDTPTYPTNPKVG